MTKGKKIFIGLFITGIVVIFAGGYILYTMLTASLPLYEGELKSSQIQESVTIYRDSLGIPYVEASTMVDGAFALGFLHAQERLFQMDFARRAGMGRLSEVMGEKTLEFDKMFLSLGIARTAQQILLDTDKELLKVLEAYANGVNYYINLPSTYLPAEFDILNYEPYEWTPLHTLIIVRMMAWELNVGLYIDMAMNDISEQKGNRMVKELLPFLPKDVPGGNGNSTPVTMDMKEYSFFETAKGFKEFSGNIGTQIGSNNWVVSGNKSVSGKPIIANDPHLTFQSPAKWYVAILRAGGWNASGFTLPGVPGIVIGKNESISWVVTNVMADETDFYEETIDSTGKQYFLDGEWKPMENVTDTINIKHREPFILTTYYTHRGPIVSDHHLYSKIIDQPLKRKKLSMRWKGNDISHELKAYIGINKASNWQEFNQALSDFKVPGQNFVYADTSGNIGYVCGASIPERNNIPGVSFYDGSESTYDWGRYIPFSDVPKKYNPKENYIATANTNPDPDFDNYITFFYAPESRKERIDELLTSKEKHSVLDFMRYQTDITSPYAKEIVRHIISAFKNVKITDENLQTALDLLKIWDYDLDAYRQAPAIYSVFVKLLIQEIMHDELGESLFNEYCFISHIPYRALLKYLKDGSPLFDDVNTPEIETKNDIVRITLSKTLSFLESKLGSDPKFWQWGALHKLTFHHYFSGENSIVDYFYNVGTYGIGGDGTTLFNTEYHLGNKSYKGNVVPYEAILGPSMRFIYDLATPDEFYMILTTGQSANIFSDHYEDMVTDWVSGKYVKIKTNPKSYRNEENMVLYILKAN